MDLFTKEGILPVELRSLPYDINSAMHFGERDFSKNGHRTIIFKDHNTKQNRIGLSAIDIRKIETVYGPECRTRDRQEKIELCQSYPGVARRKREVAIELKNLRVNSDISPPPEAMNIATTPTPEGRNVTSTPPSEPRNVTMPEELKAENKDAIKELGIDEEVQIIVEHVYKISALALKNARHMFCNASHNDSQTITEDEKKNSTDLLGVIEVIADYAKSVVDHAVSNLSIFCDASDDLAKYQRQRACNWNDNSNRCPRFYKSTKSWAIGHSTNYKNLYMPTSHRSKTRDSRFEGYNRMMGENSFGTTTEGIRVKRDLQDGQNSTTSEINIKITPTRTQQSVTTPKDSLDDTTSLVEVHDVIWKDDVNEAETPETTVDTDMNLTNKETILDTKTVRLSTVDLETPTTEGSANKVDLKDSKKITASEINKEVTQHSETQQNMTLKSSHEDKKPIVSKEDTDINITRKETVQEITIVSLNTETPTKRSRRKRDVDTEDKKPDVANSNATVEDIAEMKDSSNSSKESGAITTKSGFMKVKFEEQRLHQGRRFRSKNRKGKKVKVEWDESKMSGEKTHHTTQHRQKSEEDQERVEIRERELEKAKKKEERLDIEGKQRTERKRKLRNIKPKTVPLTKLNKEFYDERKWSDGELRYVLQQSPMYDLKDVRRRLGAVSGILKRRTCVRLHELTEDEATNYIDYLFIDSSPDYVTGKVGGKQLFGVVELFRGGQHRQHAAMMVMAMLGFYFEVARHDRDQYIRVHMRHIRPDKLHHFEKIREEATLAVPYDYQSATHPAWQFWRKIGKTGISTVATFKEHDPDGSVMKGLGQNDDLLSEIDIVKINSVYGIKCFQDNTRQRMDEEEE